MRKLESTIAQFVEDLLQTIGEATIDELRELFDGAPQGDSLLEAAVETSSPALLPSGSGRMVPSLPLRAQPAPGRARSPAPRRLPASRFSISSDSPPPPGVAEITDPESLLSLGGPGAGSASDGSAHSQRAANGVHASPDGESPAPAARPRLRPRANALLDIDEVRDHAMPEGHAEHPGEPEGESPASSVRPVGSGSTVRLSDNETFARVSNSGVVIRRKKRA